MWFLIGFLAGIPLDAAAAAFLMVDSKRHMRKVIEFVAGVQPVVVH